ncbi:hypothetical protein VTK26DRAFT_1486 [Humicola hyalothermophila]
MGQWQSQPVCNTPACLHAASQVLKYLAPNWAEMDPCTEFDKMVCYGFREHNAEDKGTMDTIQDRNDRILKRILESSSHEEAIGVQTTLLRSRSASDEYNFNLLRDSYQACMDTSAIALLGVEPVTELIVRLNATWPVSPHDLEKKISPSEYAGFHNASLFMHKMDIGIVSDTEGVKVLPDAVDPKITRVVLQFPSPSLDNTTAYFDPAKMEPYVETMGKVFRMTYPNLDDEAAANLAAAVAALEGDIVKAVLPAGEVLAKLDDVLDSLVDTKVADLAKAAPAVGIDHLVRGLMPPSAGKRVPDVIDVMVPEVWPNISQAFAKQPKAALQGFMVWKMVNKLAPNLRSSDLYELLGMPQPTDSATRWRECVYAVDSIAQHILEHYFVAVTYPDDTLRAADDMTTRIRRQFKRRLGELPWMSEPAKQRAVKKVENMVQNIGYKKLYPDVRAADSLAEYYSTLNVSASAHFFNMLSGRRHRTLKAYEEAARPTERESYGGMPVSAVNAFYNRGTNAMTIGAGIAQLPIFHNDLPDYALYGGLGAVVGHELTHGFDNAGAQYDEDAAKRQWWDNATVANYAELQRCFVEQYSAFEVEVPGNGEREKVDGELTLGENLSDAGGLRVAYDTWAAARREKPRTWDQHLPGLEAFTHEQLFFIFYGNIWCDSYTKSTARFLLENDNHAPARYRILGGTQNSRAFREAFQCQVKEPVCEAF